MVLFFSLIHNNINFSKPSNFSLRKNEQQILCSDPTALLDISKPFHRTKHGFIFMLNKISNKKPPEIQQGKWQKPTAFNNLVVFGFLFYSTECMGNSITPSVSCRFSWPFSVCMQLFMFYLFVVLFQFFSAAVSCT